MTTERPERLNSLQSSTFGTPKESGVDRDMTIDTHRQPLLLLQQQRLRGQRRAQLDNQRWHDVRRDTAFPTYTLAGQHRFGLDLGTVALMAKCVLDKAVLY